MTIEKKKDTLISLIKTLENDNLSLDEAVKTYKKSITLATDILKKLDTIETDITVIHKSASTS